MSIVCDINLPEGALILDVRSKKECKSSGYLEGSVFVETPSPPLTFSQLKTLKAKLFKVVFDIKFDRFIAIYCKKGIRAKVTKDILDVWGFTNVKVLGGIETYPLKICFK